MTQDEIFEMARQVGKNLETSEEGYRLWTYEALEAFAKLVEEKVKAECGQAATTLDEMRRRYDEHFTKALGKKDQQ